MIELPVDLLAVIPPTSESVVRRWWDSLPEGERRKVADLWDDRLEVRFFKPQADEAGRLDDWKQVPTARGGRFLASDDAWGLTEWGPGYFEYMLEHPESFPIFDPTSRTFHIGCTQHPEARACLELRKVPQDFECPVASASCPLRPLKGVRLISPSGERRASAGVFRPEDREVHPLQRLPQLSGD